ncbi:MAG: DUF885 family protein, partial [Traorella sp.]
MKKLYKIMLSLCLFFNLAACQLENEKDVQEVFDKYLDEIVQNELTSDFLNYHYMVVNKESFDIEKPEVTLGSLSLEATKQIIEESKEQLVKLHEINKSHLSEENQDIYRLLELALSQNIEYEDYLKFDFCFGDNKVNDNLITNFTEYRILNEEDIQDFITLLKDTPRYIDEGITKTRQLADEGSIQNELIQNSIIESCTKFIDSEEIEKHFHEEVVQIENLSDSKIKEYEQEVKDGVDLMQEGYKRIVELYQEIPASDYQGSLAEIQNGKDYFEYLIRVNSGSEKSVSKWLSLIDAEIEDTISEIIRIMWHNPGIYDEMEQVEIDFDNAQEIVEYLEKWIQNEYPSIGEVKYKVEYLDSSVANDLVSAYYVIPPLDAPNLNVIKVNPNNTDMLELLSTLAHEGFPGHLYQNNYMIQNEMPLIYYFLSNIGASEGWAEVCGGESYRLANIGSNDLQDMLRLNDYLNRILVEYIDMRVNYSKWDVDDIENYLDNVGLMSDIASDLYDAVIQYPALYAPYSLGTYQVLHLKEYAMDKLEEKFYIEEFNQAFLDSGCVHFEIIEKNIKEYVK